MKSMDAHLINLLCQFTNVSDAHSTTSWLDHIICSFDFYSIISDLFILDKLPSSDHLPVCCTCTCSGAKPLTLRLITIAYVVKYFSVKSTFLMQ